jgi:hypothetical protein
MEGAMPRDELDRRIVEAVFSDFGENMPEMGKFIQERADLWTEGREVFFTELVRNFDCAEKISHAEAIWERGLRNPIVKYVSRKTLEHHEKLTRALCADECVIQNLGIRCWDQLGITRKQSTAREIIEEHLKHYGEVRQVVADEMISGALEFPEGDAETSKKKNTAKRLLTVLELIGEGFISGRKP